MNHSGSNAYDLLSFCDNANQKTQAFHAELSSFEKGSEKWNEFLWSGCDSENNLIQVTAFHEIRKSDDPSWLSPLFERLKTETFPTTLAAIFCAIGGLGGFQSREDYAHYFEETDINIRGAAMQILYFLPDEDAIELLLKVLQQDPNPKLRSEAAERLAYLHSDAGLPLLLDSFENKSFLVKIGAVRALCILKNPTGLNALHHLIESHQTLSKQDRTILIHHVCGLLIDVGIELPPCDRPEDFPLESIIKKATDWIENALNVDRPLTEM
ncbi:HEAT repeat domain-containing protein [Gimesia aquarii]|uniref:PBS lyase HEAT-like repeat protein n=1 Tax=Gimesia aquarii TaxID=2527964 RepID=A0A517WU38_9PLAN|nr:HEAT repeat domain-containing protein [Gimesia aquarii]QDU08754.1 PBS lyase HEAT-like repeat protein [Gimesia aquarii]